MKRTTELTPRERKGLEAWVRKGFDDYADLCRKRGDRHAATAEIRARDMAKIYYHTQAELDAMFYRGNIHHNIGIQVQRYGAKFLAVLRDEVELSEGNGPLRLRRDLYSLMERGCQALALVDLMLACTCEHGITFFDIFMFADPLQSYLDRIKENLNHFRYPKRPRRFKDPVPLSIEFLIEAKSQHQIPANRQYDLPFSLPLHISKTFRRNS